MWKGQLQKLDRYYVTSNLISKIYTMFFHWVLHLVFFAGTAMSVKARHYEAYHTLALEHLCTKSQGSYFNSATRQLIVLETWDSITCQSCGNLRNEASARSAFFTSNRQAKHSACAGDTGPLPQELVAFIHAITNSQGLYCSSLLRANNFSEYLDRDWFDNSFREIVGSFANLSRDAQACLMSELIVTVAWACGLRIYYKIMGLPLPRLPTGNPNNETPKH